MVEPHFFSLAEDKFLPHREAGEGQVRADWGAPRPPVRFRSCRRPPGCWWCGARPGRGRSCSTGSAGTARDRWNGTWGFSLVERSRLSVHWDSSEWGNDTIAHYALSVNTIRNPRNQDMVRGLVCGCFRVVWPRSLGWARSGRRCQTGVSGWGWVVRFGWHRTGSRSGFQACSSWLAGWLTRTDWWPGSSAAHRYHWPKSWAPAFAHSPGSWWPGACRLWLRRSAESPPQSSGWLNFGFRPTAASSRDRGQESKEPFSQISPRGD